MPDGELGGLNVRICLTPYEHAAQMAELITCIATIPVHACRRLAVGWPGIQHTYLELPGEHAFMRDEGARYDPEMTDRVFAEAIALYRRTFA